MNTLSTGWSSLPKLRKLRAALVVAQCGTIAGAARELGLSQPAVTRAVQSLEREIGVPLFHRSSRRVACTEAGERLSARVARAQEQLRLAETNLPGQGATERTSGPLTTQASDHEFSALIGVATEGTISAAARASGVSQPALNRSLRALENRLGVALFHRTSSGMRLTNWGEGILRRVKLARAEIRQGQEEVAALQGVWGGRICIGALPLTLVRLVPLAVKNLLGRYKDGDVAIVDGTYEALLAALRLGDIDVLVGTIRCPPPVEDIVSEELFEDDIAIVVGATHPLTERMSISLKDCLDWDWVLPFKSVPLRIHFEQMLDAARLPHPRRVIETDSMIAVRTLLLGGKRLAILSRHQVYDEVAWGFLKVLPVHLDRVLRPVGVTLRADYSPTPMASALLQELRGVATVIRREQRSGFHPPATSIFALSDRHRQRRNKQPSRRKA